MRVFFFFLSLLLVTAQPLFATEAPRLVEIYCDTMVARPFDAAEWKALELRLSSRAQLTTPADQSAYKACITANAGDFEEGEFLLKGRDLVLRTLNRATTPTALSPEEEAERAQAPRVADLVERAAHYETLWREFLDHVRARIAASTAITQLVENAKE